jgi:hypothetical protein
MMLALSLFLTAIEIFPETLLPVLFVAAAIVSALYHPLFKGRRVYI